MCKRLSHWGEHLRRRAAQSAHVQDARRQRSKGSSTPKSLADPFLYNEDASRCVLDIGAPPGDVTLWRACDAKFEQLTPMQSKFSRRAAPTLHGAAGRRWISLTRRPLLHPSRRATSAGLCEQARQRPMAPGAPPKLDLAENAATWWTLMGRFPVRFGFVFEKSPHHSRDQSSASA